MVRCIQSMNATETAHAITMKSQDLGEKSIYQCHDSQILQSVQPSTSYIRRIHDEGCLQYQKGTDLRGLMRGGCTDSELKKQFIR